MSVRVCSVVGMCAIGVSACGNPFTSPTDTQAKLVSNDSWRMVYNGTHAQGPNNARGYVVDLGPGRQCASAQLLFGRRPAPAEGSFLTLTVGQSSETVRDGREITVCGTGAVAP